MRKTDGIMGPVRLLAGLAATRCGGGATIVGSPSDLKTRLPTAEGMAPSPCDSCLGHPVRGETLDGLAVSGPALPGGLLPTSTNDARQRAEWPWRASAAPKGDDILAPRAGWLPWEEAPNLAYPDQLSQQASRATGIPDDTHSACKRESQAPRHGHLFILLERAGRCPRPSQ